MRVRLVIMFMVGFANIIYGQPATSHSEVEATIIEDSIQQYFMLSSLPVNHLKSGEIIAVPYPGEAQVIDAFVVAGKLPSGTSLYPNGLVVVSNSTLVEAGTYSFTIETTLANEEVRRHELNWHVTPAKSADRDAIFFVTNKKNIREYVNGEMLAHAHDPDGDVTSALVIKGQLPQGSLLSERGNVIVSDNSVLEVGTYNAWIVTTDAQKGLSLFILTLNLENAPVAGN